jgi:hypothetical protein
MSDEEAVISDLKDLDVARITPIDALNILNQLNDRLIGTP